MVESTSTNQKLSPNNPETGQSSTDKAGERELIKGMRELEFKNVVQDLQSKKDWDLLGVPAEIQQGLTKLSYLRPSIIQSFSLPRICDKPTTNFAFQSINGSGKTGAFVVPSLMRVDKTVQKIQVIILANTRELIRQIHQVSNLIGKNTQIQIVLGESDAKLEGAQIVVTTPGALKSKLQNKSTKLDLTSLKMVVYDEADELFIQESNLEGFAILLKHFEKINVAPQHLLFSATFDTAIIQKVKEFIGEFELYPLKKEALKLKGVKNFKIMLNEAEKVDFTAKLHTQLEQAMTMVFVNKKDSATALQYKLSQQKIAAKLLIGGMEIAERDALIDQFRMNEFTTLISTNVLARGIDVPEVDIVINFDVPIIKRHGWQDPDYANYMHRVGRTGRFGTDGISVSFMCNEVEQDMMNLIGKHYEIEIKELTSFEQLVSELNAMRGGSAGGKSVQL